MPKKITLSDATGVLIGMSGVTVDAAFSFPDWLSIEGEFVCIVWIFIVCACVCTHIEETKNNQISHNLTVLGPETARVEMVAKEVW